MPDPVLGQYADDETGRYNNRHRYYDPAAARYTTSDPLGLAPADDPHSYVLNPTGWSDPPGLTACGTGGVGAGRPDGALPDETVLVRVGANGPDRCAAGSGVTVQASRNIHAAMFDARRLCMHL